MILILHKFHPLAEDLQRAVGMMPFTSVSVLAGRFLEPLTKPWAAVGGGLAVGGAAHIAAIAQGARLAWRLLAVLLTL